MSFFAAAFRTEWYTKGLRFPVPYSKAMDILDSHDRGIRPHGSVLALRTRDPSRRLVAAKGKEIAERDGEPGTVCCI